MTVSSYMETLSFGYYSHSLMIHFYTNGAFNIHCYVKYEKKK